MKRSRTNKVPNSEKQQDAFHSKIQDTTAELLERLERLPAKHDKVNEALKAVHSQGERLLHGTKMSQSAKNKMIALYNTAQKQCESEHGTLRHLLSDIQKIRRLR
uniref:Uncharacterized protein n=1 Tax=Ditylenchus dipsaci TaxID=166011 RepID=A0A915CX91_9BILA